MTLADGHVERFAPSPNGEMHIGHALSALTGWRRAQQQSGRFLLRIEDIDTGRTREQFVDRIFDDLAWLGITWEEPVRRQSEHFGFYKTQTGRLLDMGLLYPCFATRSEISNAIVRRPEMGADPDGAPLYPGLHKDMAADEIERRKADGEPFALRLDMAKALAKADEMTDGAPITYRAQDVAGDHKQIAARPERWGDAVIVRKDVPTSYHLAVVADDHLQGITHVTRGTDLEAATDLHRLLQTLLGFPAPVYHHHRLICDEDGRKLSKSNGAASLRALRERGMAPEDVFTQISEIVDQSMDR